ncbi:hypothetical protein LCGC14_1973390 [marine sediment metagenome]|uniref:Uncharacterized protein n=1 Tax=marine sediment metagenome TaxID=412755 RepID=A0A0F9FZ88_9ZZZZ
MDLKDTTEAAQAKQAREKLRRILKVLRECVDLLRGGSKGPGKP